MSHNLPRNPAQIRQRHYFQDGSGRPRLPVEAFSRDPEERDAALKMYEVRMDEWWNQHRRNLKDMQDEILAKVGEMIAAQAD